VTRERVGRPFDADSVSVNDVMPTAAVAITGAVVLVLDDDVVDVVVGGF
jgi:hypothetical protein